MICPFCQSQNDDGAEVCFHCRAVLSAVTRGTLIASRYRILSPLGRGGMGAVYRARDEVLDDEVALKILRPEVAGTPEMAGRFRSEIKLARKVSHWNVCRIHEYGEDGALQYISMELVSGSTLKDRLRAGPLPAGEAFDVAIQIAEGLSAIHKVGIVHRDLKSPNVMIDAEGTAKVMDFGIAKPAAAGTDPGASTGYVLGSPEYMSPEQARGRRADFRSDLYSLGVVIFEAFTGRVPFRGTTPVATLMMHVEAPPPIDDPGLALPPALVPVLRSAMAKDPADRFPDAPAMATALRAARGDKVDGARAVLPEADGSPTDVVHTRPLAAAGRRPSSRLAVGGIVALALAAALLIRRGGPTTNAPMPIGTPSPSAMASVSPVVMETPAIAVSTSATGTLGPSAHPSPSVATTSVPPRPASTMPAATAPSPPRVVAAATEAVPSPPPPPASPAASPSPSPPPIGWLLVLATPWAEVTVDGGTAVMTPLDKIPLAPGSHGVVLTHPDYRSFTRKVEVRAGEVTRLRFDFAEQGVKRR
jgi:eukaryotic-like serine/threonine-protein kinase